jgi:hypothetical protein
MEQESFWTDADNKSDGEQITRFVCSQNVHYLLRFQVITAASVKMTAFWDISLIMEAVRTSETSVYFNETTWRYIPEGCYLR